MKKTPRILRLGTACLMMLITSACARYSTDEKPLQQWTPERDESTRLRVVGDRSTELLVLVAFSGGGTRAASFAYGALQELAETEVMTEKGAVPLLKEIDMISSVSGGSFTSAYYGLYGDRIFDDFEERFLRKDVQGDLVAKIFWPLNWFKLFSPTYGKSDMAAEHYDKILFEGATFADLFRPGAPIVVINSTDLGTGYRIPFVASFFDILCSDLSQYTIARAVTASSAVPGLFSPITLKNFAGSCGYELPAWLSVVMKDEGMTSRKYEAQGMIGYIDREEQPWLHLVDGGVADNLGLRSFYNIFAIFDDRQHALKTLHHEDARKILIISVDSHTKTDTAWSSKNRNPSLMQMVGSVTSIQIARYSLDTREIVRYTFEKWAKELSTTGHPVDFYFIDVSFAGIKNKDDWKRLNDIGTNFDLSDEEVDLLIASARQVLRQSPEFQKFLSENKRQARP